MDVMWGEGLFGETARRCEMRAASAYPVLGSTRQAFGPGGAVLLEIAEHDLETKHGFGKSWAAKA
jgi:hypothetical protein